MSQHVEGNENLCHNMLKENEIIMSQHKGNAISIVIIDSQSISAAKINVQKQTFSNMLAVLFHPI